jgi:hypothetical protein
MIFLRCNILNIIYIYSRMTSIHISELKDIISKVSYESINFRVDAETKLTEGNLNVTALENCQLPVSVDELSDLRVFLNIKVSRYSYKRGKWWSWHDDQSLRSFNTDGSVHVSHGPSSAMLPESTVHIVNVTKGERHTIKIKLEDDVPDGPKFHWRISASNHSKMFEDTIHCEYETTDRTNL